MELKEIQAFDCSVLPHYINPQLAQEWFQYYEFKASVLGTFGGVFKRMQLKPGEEWKVVGAASKGSVEGVLAEMDEIGVERAVLLAAKTWSQREHTLMVDVSVDMVGEWVKKGKGRIIGAASYNPFRIQESLEELERAVKTLGFTYVWYHPISFGMRYDDRRCYPLYMKCLELGIPVGMQTGHSAEALTSEPGHPMYADNVAIEFPDLKIVLTHTGYPWVDEWCSMIWRHANVYGMLNAYFPSGYQPTTITFLDSPRGRDKILSGSHGFGMSRWKKEFLELPIKDETKKKVLRENPIKVFGSL